MNRINIKITLFLALFFGAQEVFCAQSELVVPGSALSVPRRPNLFPIFALKEVRPLFECKDLNQKQIEIRKIKQQMNSYLEKISELKDATVEEECQKMAQYAARDAVKERKNGASFNKEDVKQMHIFAYNAQDVEDDFQIAKKQVTEVLQNYLRSTQS